MPNAGLAPRKRFMHIHELSAPVPMKAVVGGAPRDIMGQRIAAFYDAAFTQAEVKLYNSAVLLLDQGIDPEGVHL